MTLSLHNGEATAISLNNTLHEVDLRQHSSCMLKYDALQDRYVYDSESAASDDKSQTTSQITNIGIIPKPIVRLLRLAFLPEGVTSSYYRYMKYRILQRYISSVVHVLGTQSLLLGLGFRGSRQLGVSAAMYWVLKDALGKIVRMVWASKMGGKFDSDAKRWRFRASLLFALGNGLEVGTYIAPQWFLLLATLGNAAKQIGMLTSSATRNALYTTFKTANTKTENIGDITAKGEAQIAVVDLVGIGSGVLLSRAIGVSVRSVCSVWISLQILEIMFMYQEIRSVVFRKLNFERLSMLVDMFVTTYEEELQIAKDKDYNILPSPDDMAKTEHLFLPPKHLSRRANAFGSVGRAKLSPDELTQLQIIFAKEKYLLVVGANQKKETKLRIKKKKSTIVEENCHIILHVDATNSDIVKSTIALAILRRKLREKASSSSGALSSTDFRSSNCMELINESQSIATKLFPRFLTAVQKKGWETPTRFMFGRVRRRAVWCREISTLDHQSDKSINHNNFEISQPNNGPK